MENQHTPNQLPAGTMLAGKYRVERELGRGGMGIVLAARHLGLDEQVAIKVLTPQALADAGAVARFEREARAAVRIKSEHVVRVTDVGRLDSGEPFMVMEYLEGEDLAGVLAREKAVPIGEAVDYLLQACVAIADAHRVGIIHRDLKPANLFCALRSDGQRIIKVLDFGISKLMDANASGMAMTKTSTMMGSPLYMSPEQIRSAKDVDVRSDIWALGVVLFELIAGAVPFWGEAFGDLVVRIATEPTPRLSERRPGVPPELDAIVSRCLEKDPNRRYADVRELAVALLPFSSRPELVHRILGIYGARGGPVSGAGVPPGARVGAPPSAVVVAPSKESSSSTGAQFSRPEATFSPWAASRLRRGKSPLVLFSVAALVGVVALIGGFAFWKLQSASRGTPAARSGEIVPAPTLAAAPPPTAAPTVPPPTAEGGVTAPADSPEPRAPVAPAQAVMSATPHTSKGGPRAKAPATESTSVPAATAPTTSSPKAAAASNPNCDPPYTLDEQGRKKFKPECFLPSK